MQMMLSSSGETCLSASGQWTVCRTRCDTVGAGCCKEAWPPWSRVPHPPMPCLPYTAGQPGKRAQARQRLACCSSSWCSFHISSSVELMAAGRLGAAGGGRGAAAPGDGGGPAEGGCEGACEYGAPGCAGSGGAPLRRARTRGGPPAAVAVTFSLLLRPAWSEGGLSARFI